MKSAFTILAGTIIALLIRLGIPGPRPNILLGNALQLNGSIYKAQQRWRDQYGDVLGCYIFGKTELQVSDPTILKEIMLKNFESFTDRVNFIPVEPLDESNLFSNTILFMRDERWKRVRSTINQVFTTGSLKRMIPILEDCTARCAQLLTERMEERKEIDLKEMCGGLTMEMIARCGFGACDDIQDDDRNEFVTKAKSFFVLDKSPGIIMLFLFPKLAPIFQRFSGYCLMRPKENAFFTEQLSKIFEERLKERESADCETTGDFFGLLVESLMEEEKDKDIPSTSEEDISYLKTRRKNRLSRLEIISQGFMFLLAGYDTSSTTMSLLLYHLAYYPEIQRKLRDEIKTHLIEPSISYEQLMKCTYLEQVLKEVLRMYPTFVRVNRVCTTPTVLSNGVPVRKDDVISIPIRVLHYREDLFSNPNEFDPGRFSPENRANINPLAYIPFGFGPRNCIGMRFAQIAIKTAVSMMLTKFEFHLTADSPSLPLDFQSFGPIKIKEKLLVNITPHQ